MLLSRKMLQRILGVLWLIDGIIQLFPQMWTMNMVNGIMKPMLNGQPGFVEPSLQFIVTQTTSHLFEVNSAHLRRPDLSWSRLPVSLRSLGEMAGVRLHRVGFHRLVWW